MTVKVEDVAADFKAQIKRAAKKGKVVPLSICADFIKEMEEKYNERVGSRGKSLSASEMTQLEATKTSAIDKAIKATITANIAAKFPVIDKELFTMRRFIGIVGNKIVKDSRQPFWLDDSAGVPPLGSVMCDAPLFTRTNTDNDETQLCSGHCQVLNGKNRRGGDITRYIAVSVKVPRCSDAMLNKQRPDFLAHCSTVMRSLFLDKTIGVHIKLMPVVAFETCWIPSTAALVVTNSPPVPAGDPALLAWVYEQRFLLGMWDIKEEENFEHLLREFTAGSFDNVVKERKK